MAEFLADESVDFRVVESLRKAGYKVEAVIEVDPGISDDQVLQIANELEAILLTEDKDFGELTFRLKKPNQGIILIRMSGNPIEEKMQKIMQVLEGYLDQLSHCFTVITQDKVRIRKRD
jgi:predicted nuclease of predicted toxin-antitoxin system